VFPPIAGREKISILDPLPEPERHRSGSASKPCVTVSKSHGSSTSWRLSRAPLVAISFL